MGDIESKKDEELEERGEGRPLVLPGERRRQRDGVERHSLELVRQ